jgi:hypothetical protein
MGVSGTTFVRTARSFGPAIVLLVLVSCGKNTAPMDKQSTAAAPGAGPASPGGAPGAPMPSPHGAWAGGGGAMPQNAWTISGTIDLAPAFTGKTQPTDVLYIFAREPGQGQPVAVERYPSPVFPLQYALQSGHGPAGTNPPPSMEVVAKLSRSGMAGPPKPGDLEGRYDGVATAGASGIDVVLDIEH